MWNNLNRAGIFRCVQMVSIYSKPLVSSDINSMLGGVLSGSGVKLLEQRAGALAQLSQTNEEAS